MEQPPVEVNPQVGDGTRILVSLFLYNEGEKFRTLLESFPEQREYDVLVVDDGSSDGMGTHAENAGLAVLRNPRNLGLGASIKRAFRYVIEHGYDVLVIMAANGKDSPAEIPRLLDPILHQGVDYVQGSRFLPGGVHENMPFYRLLATRYVHPWTFSLFSGTRVTESANGFRAMRSNVLRDERIRWDQSWLDQYELEQYVHFKVCRLGYRRTEVPVSKRYPHNDRSYTKVRPITGWWSMLKPVIYLGLGLRK